MPPSARNNQILHLSTAFVFGPFFEPFLKGHPPRPEVLKIKKKVTFRNEKLRVAP